LKEINMNMGLGNQSTRANHHLKLELYWLCKECILLSKYS